MDERAGFLFTYPRSAERLALGSGGDGGVGSDAVEPARRGDLGAFEAIYDTYRDRIAAYLFRLLRDPDLAADLTQDVFVCAFRAIGRTQPGLKIRPWLFAIATNLAISYCRHHRLLRWIPLDGAPEPAAPDRIEQRVADRDLLGGALAALPPDQAACFLLWAREGLSYEEIGAAVGISTGAAKTRAYRARLTLARTLRDQGEDRR